jgi:NADH-quinone oxidoreductase subunit L
VLAVGAVAAGFFAGPVSHFLAESRSVVLANRAYTAKYNIDPAGHEFSWAVAAVSTAIVLSGAGLAYRLYRNGGPAPVPEPLRGAYVLSQNKVYVDEIYAGTVVKPAEFLAAAGRQFDGFLDSLARLVAVLPRLLAALLRPLQNGLVQFYALGMVLGLAVFVTFIVFRITR